MAAACKVTLSALLSGLGLPMELADAFSTTTPVTKNHGYQIQAVTDTSEALNLGDVSTIELIIMKCVSNDVHIDTSYVSSFNAEIKIQEGKWAIFQPTGTVHIKNVTTTEVSTVEYWIIGTA